MAVNNPGIMGSVLVIISQFLNNSKRNARQPVIDSEDFFRESKKLVPCVVVFPVTIRIPPLISEESCGMKNLGNAVLALASDFVDD